MDAFVVKDLLPQSSSPLIFITENTTLQECLSLLTTKQILSAPVFNTIEHRFVGILDKYEIMSYIAFASWKPSSNVTLQQFVAKTDLFQPACNLLGTRGEPAYDDVKSLWIQKSTTSALETLEMIGKGVYRLLVEESGTHRLLSQSDLVSFLHRNIHKFGSAKDKTVQEAFKKKQVHTITTKRSALDGFQTMRLQQVSAVPVIDDNGALLATLSGSDLRGFCYEKMADVLLPILEFLNLQHGGAVKPSITCKSTDSVGHVIEQFVSNHVHRLWVVDDNNHPTGVVSLGDVALYFFTCHLRQ